MRLLPEAVLLLPLLDSLWLPYYKWHFIVEVNKISSCDALLSIQIPPFDWYLRMNVRDIYLLLFLWLANAFISVTQKNKQIYSDVISSLIVFAEMKSVFFSTDHCLLLLRSNNESPSDVRTRLFKWSGISSSHFFSQQYFAIAFLY